MNSYIYISILFSFLYLAIYIYAKKILYPNLSPCLYIDISIFLSLSIFVFLCVSSYIFVELLLYLYLYFYLYPCLYLYHCLFVSEYYQKGNFNLYRYLYLNMAFEFFLYL